MTNHTENPFMLDSETLWHFWLTLNQIWEKKRAKNTKDGLIDELERDFDRSTKLNQFLSTYFIFPW